MSEPETTPAVWTAIGIMATGILGALAALLRVIFGSREDRAKATDVESTAGERAAALALSALSVEREETQRHRVHRDDCEERLRAVHKRLDEMEAALAEVTRQLATERQRTARLEAEMRLARGMLGDLLRPSGDTPPDGIYGPDDVRAAMAREDGQNGH